MSRDDLSAVPDLPTSSVDYGAVIKFRFAMLRQGGGALFCDARPGQHARRSTKSFAREQAAWLGDYALFMAAKDAHGGIAWTGWEPELAAREPAALARWSERLAAEIAAYKFWQFEFFRQWGAVREACCAARHPHHGRRADLCGARQRGCVDGAATVLAGRAGQSAEGCRRSAGLFQCDRAVVGQSDLSLGAACGRMASAGGLRGCAA